jgi:hypothetical protein
LNTWDGARADEFFANLFGYRQQQIGDGRDMDYTIPAAQARSWLARGSPWMSGASSTWFAHTRFWTGRFDKPNVSDLSQRVKVHASQLWWLKSRGGLAH